MESKEEIKYSSKINEFQWFLVQFDHTPQKLIHQIFEKKDLIWSETLQSVNDKEIVLIRGPEKPELAYIIYKAKSYQDAIKQYKFLQTISMKLFNSPQEIDNFMINMHHSSGSWLLVIYNTTKIQSVFAIVHVNDVVLKKHESTNNLLAYIREGEEVFKGAVVKVTNDTRYIIFMMNYIKNKLLKLFESEVIFGNELIGELNRAELGMYNETETMLQLYKSVETKTAIARQRLKYLKNIARLMVKVKNN